MEHRLDNSPDVTSRAGVRPAMTIRIIGATIATFRRLLRALRTFDGERLIIDELRCRRLVVVDSRGADRIVASAGENEAQLVVLARESGPLADPTGVEIVAGGVPGELLAGIHLVAVGDAIAGVVLSEQRDGFEAYRLGTELFT